MIAILTYGIAVLPFIHDEQNRIRHAALRVLNVCIGCIISCIGAVAICPRSTSAVVRGHFADVMVLSGTACGAVLRQATGAFSGSKNTEYLGKVLREGRTDPVHLKYLSVTDKLRAVKPLLRFLDSDPMRLIFPKERHIEKAGSSLFITRAFRVIQTVILVDSLVRNKTESLGLSADELRVLDEIGTLLEKMLTYAANEHWHDEDFDVFEEQAFRKFGDLYEFRYDALTRQAEAERDKGGRNSVHMTQAEWLQKLTEADHVPLLDFDTADYGRILLFGMMEHLIVRVIRLCYTWRGICGNSGRNTMLIPPLRQASIKNVMKPTSSENAFLTLMETDSEDFDDTIV